MPNSKGFRELWNLGPERPRTLTAGPGGKTLQAGRAPSIALAVLLVAVLGSCALDVPQDAFDLSSEDLGRRQQQTRVFHTDDEARMLAASGGVLQDLGFTIDESETDLGVIVASKRRDATEVRQIVTAIAGRLFSGFLMGAMGGTSEEIPVDDEQVIRASLVTMPTGTSGERMAVRVTLQRVVWDTAGNISRQESIDDPQIYQEFFEALSHSVFLEAHKI